MACAAALVAAPFSQRLSSQQLSAQQPSTLKAAGDALGVATIKRLRFTASGTNFTVGQNFTASEPWPPVPVKSFTAVIDYDAGSMRQDILREMGTVMPRGGGAPFTGEQRVVQVNSGVFAWNVTPAPQAPGGPAPVATPAPEAAVERMLQLWATPQGFVRAAMANQATTRQVKGGTSVSFIVGGKYKMEGLINAQNQVERVRTWINHPVVGDMPVETVYSGYRNFDGVQFPSHIVQSQDGFPSLDLTVASVAANPAVDIAVPDNVRTFQPAPTKVDATKLADGVFFLTGGSHHSLAIEMKDYIVVVDTPNNEERGRAVLAKAKDVIPGKPIRYVVAEHHHWDHLGGIRAAMDAGATIVTHQSNKALIERVAKAPHTLVPDGLSVSKKSAKIETVGAMRTLTDGTRSIELHLLTGYGHSGDTLVVYLPKEKILAQADAWVPAASPTGSIVVTAVPFAAALYDNIQRLKLNVQTIVPFHGARTTDVAGVAKDAGR
jgi:glyoxylase-like metal-dependent hydrolase (beta-lactamase superfamily II)